MKLYIYEHCPFCARTRFVAGKLNLDLDVVVIDYDDDKTTTDIIGSKQVPLLVKDNGEAISESLDIIKYFLTLGGSSETNTPSKAVSEWQSSAFLPLQKVGYPRWSSIGLKEFNTASSKAAWRSKKETEALNFDALLADTPAIAKEVEGLINKVSDVLAFDKTMTIVDEAVVFSILRGFFSEPTINWDESINEWMESASAKTKVTLLK